MITAQGGDPACCDDVTRLPQAPVVQDVPAGIVLAWSYERGRNVWCPVFLHMLINYISISIEISFGL